MTSPIESLAAPFEALASRRVVLVGGKGGTGKTTVAAIAALRFASLRRTILFTTDPASNLEDLFAGTSLPQTLQLETLDSGALYSRFLEENLEKFLEIGDRGTYLDRDEVRRFFELALPGVDELMAWLRIGDIAAEEPEAIVVVDTAPTGHTLRMLSSAGHFEEFARALDAMQEKHRSMVRQFMRRESRDAIDAFIEQFDLRGRRHRELLADAEKTSFVPVFLSEPWVVEQTVRLVAEVRGNGLDVPFAVLNRAVAVPDCEADRARQRRDEEARATLAPLDVVALPRYCRPLDSAAALRGDGVSAAPAPSAPLRTAPVRVAPLTFLAGKGGVGKTTSSAALALRLAAGDPTGRYVVISVDPAHSLRDVFAREAPPPNLAVETIDTRAKWSRFRETLGREIERAVDALTPGGVSLAYDGEAMRRLVDVAPPGADELFAVTRLAELASDDALAGVIVDTAPTGHFLRLLELPRTAGDWVREFMRLLLRYREVVTPGSLGEELVRASRALKELDEVLHSERSAVVVVTRPERLVVRETRRLLDELRRRGITVGGVIANYVTPASECPCDRSMRAWESASLSDLAEPLHLVARRDHPVVKLEELGGLVSSDGLTLPRRSPGGE